MAQAPSPTRRFLDETAAIAGRLDEGAVEAMAGGLAAVRDRGGRLFVLGVGGGAGHASHAVCDFRRLCGIEAYTPADNVAELTARTNDEGWDAAYERWLETSRLGPRDAVLVFSVGGGSREHGISVNLVRAVELAHRRGAPMFGIVGRADSATARLASACVVVPSPPERLTAHVEAFQAVLWHLLVSHPLLALHTPKWESATAQPR